MAVSAHKWQAFQINAVIGLNNNYDLINHYYALLLTVSYLLVNEKISQKSTQLFIVPGVSLLVTFQKPDFSGVRLTGVFRRICDYFLSICLYSNSLSPRFTAVLLHFLFLSAIFFKIWAHNKQTSTLIFGNFILI